jgi:tetratricopeptide (TPR) repeat protein
MKNVLFISLVMMVLSISTNAQEERNYNVSIESRNLSIKYAIQADKIIDKGLVKESFPIITKAILTDSTQRKSYDILYRACLVGQNYNDSLMRYFFIAKRIFDADDEICYKIAELYKMRKEYKKSIKHYSKAIELIANKEEKSKLTLQYYSGRAYCYVMTNMYKQAIPDYSVYLDENPDDAVILTNRGVCYQNDNNKEKAIADWKKASVLGNSTAKAYLNRITRK